MPLLLMVGLPCSGKSSRAKQIKENLETKYKKTVKIISENEVLRSKNINKNDFFMNSQKEKEVRGILKSGALRELTNDNVVILDACNYIKGYRYEIYCAVKNSKTTQLTIECLVHRDTGWLWNENRSGDDAYSKDVYDALALRYETPDSRNRWDCPLIGLQAEDVLPLQDIYDALFNRKPPPPNQSTQCAPLSSSDFLHQLDQITQQVVQEILENQKMGGSNSMKIGNSVFNGYSGATPAALARYRRQFLNYTKLHPPSSSADTPQHLSTLFVDFLNTTLDAQ